MPRCKSASSQESGLGLPGTSGAVITAEVLFWLLCPLSTDHDCIKLLSSSAGVGTSGCRHAVDSPDNVCLAALSL